MCHRTAKYRRPRIPGPSRLAHHPIRPIAQQFDHTSTISFYFPAFNSILHHRPRSTRPMASRPSVKGRPGRKLSDHDSSSSRSQSSEAPRPFACDWNNRGRGAQCEKVRTICQPAHRLSAHRSHGRDITYCSEHTPLTLVFTELQQEV